MEVLANEVDYLKKLNNSFKQKYTSKVDNDAKQYLNEGIKKSYINGKNVTQTEISQTQTIDKSLPVNKKKFHKLTTSYDFLKRLPTTKIHNILQLEKELKEAGVIKFRYETDLFWKTANKTWTKNMLKEISVDDLKEKIIKSYNMKLFKKNSFKNNPEIEENGVQEFKPHTKVGKILRSSSRNIKFPKKPSFPQLHSFDSSFPNKVTCVVPKLEITNNIRQYKKMRPNDRLKLSEKDYYQTNLDHVVKCNAYQIAILNKAAMSRMMKRTKLEVQRPKSYHVNDLCTTEDFNHFKGDKEAVIYKNKTFVPQPHVDFNTMKTTNLIPLPPIKSRNNSNQKRKFVKSNGLFLSILENKKEKDHENTPLSVRDLVINSDKVKELRSTIEMWSNYS